MVEQWARMSAAAEITALHLVINTPASVNDGYWTWRLSWTIEQLDAEPLAR